MSWVTPHAWSASEVLTNWKLNTYIRDAERSAKNLWDRAVQVYLTSNQGVPDSEYTAIRWNALQWETSGNDLWAVGNGAQFQAPVAGFYALDVTTEWQNATGGIRLLGYSFNDVGSRYDLSMYEDTNGGVGIYSHGHDIVQMTTADFLEVVVFQNATIEDMYIVGGNNHHSRCGFRFLGGAT